MNSSKVSGTDQQLDSAHEAEEIYYFNLYGFLILDLQVGLATTT